MEQQPYEFSEDQNKSLRRLARLMKFSAVLFLFLGIILGIFCGFTIVNFTVRGSIYLLLTIVALISGVWTNSISYSFRLIVETTGKDIEHLMNAFNTLKRVYFLQFAWLIVLTLLFASVLLTSAISGIQAISILKPH